MVLIIFLCTGLIFGSFISMLSYRIPLKQDFIIKPSNCPSCKHKLSILDLIPFFSWLFLLGRCRYCKKDINIRYPLTEIFTSFLFGISYLYCGISLVTFILCFLVIILVTITIIDFEHYIIPTFLQIILFLISIFWVIEFKYSMTQIISGLFAGFLSSYILSVGFKVVRKKEGLGFGDVQFISSAGIILGAENLIIFYLMSGIFGTVNGFIWQYFLKKKLFPFAPSLSLALFLCLIIPYAIGSSWNSDVKILDSVIFKLIF